MMTTTSKRTRDGKPKGHWPRGKRRNGTDPASAALVLEAVRQKLGAQHTGAGGAAVHAARRISVRALAAAVGVNERTVRRWLSGEDMPPADRLLAVQSWVGA